MKKEGLSTVVTTLIIILLVLVAIGIVWVVIRNIISEGAEEISLGKFTIDLQIKNVNVAVGSVDVRVKRNSGKGELSGIKFLVSDGVKTEDFDMPTTMGELAEQTFTLDYTGLVKEISIAPILKSESGKEFFGNEIDKYENNELYNLIFENNLILDPLFNEEDYWTSAPNWDKVSVVLDGNDVVTSAEIRTDGNVQVISDYLPVDPYKTYRFSIWIKSDDSTTGTRYLGHYAYDSSKTAIDSYNYAGTSCNNCYFWHGDIPAGTWQKITGYIFSCDTLTWTDPSETTLYNFRMDCNAGYLRMRFLNYYNEGTYVTNWFALPRVEEV
jgi:hypothetical protein